MNLRSDVRVQAEEVQVAMLAQDRRGGLFVARMDAELRCVASGPHERVRVRFDAGVRAQQHPGRAVARERRIAPQFVE